MDAIDVLVYFVLVTLLLQLLTKHSLPCKRLLTSVCKHVNNSSTTPHHTQIISFAIIKLFLLFNIGDKTNNIDIKRPVFTSLSLLLA